MRAWVYLTIVCLLFAGCGPKEVTGKVLGAWRNSISDDELYIIREGTDVLVCYKEGREVRKIPTETTNGHGLEFPKNGKRLSLFYVDSTDRIQVMGVEYNRIAPNISDSLYPEAKKLSVKLVTCLEAAQKAGYKTKEEVLKLKECKPYLEAISALESSFKSDRGERISSEKIRNAHQAQEIIAILHQIMKKDHTALYVYGLEIWE